MPSERILITVKTYPTLSRKYVETVCTAGINEAGDWRRLYPIRFRYLDEVKQFKLYDRVEVDVADQPHDGRVETRKPRSETLKVLGGIKDWGQRHDWVGPTIFPSLQAMVDDNRTIGPIRVKRILEWQAIQAASDWSAKQQQLLRQEGLWATEEPKRLEKIPFEFRIRWIDGDGTEHDHLFISWEVCQTWRSYRHSYSDPIAVMRDHWMNTVFSSNNDLALFMGNSAQFRQNFMVCGTYHPPKGKISDAKLF